MCKKDIYIAICGIVFYSIGFVLLGILGKISLMIGGILLGIFLVRIGVKVSKKRKVLGNVIRIFGGVFAIYITFLVLVAILSELFF